MKLNSKVHWNSESMYTSSLVHKGVSRPVVIREVNSFHASLSSAVFPQAIQTPPIKCTNVIWWVMLITPFPCFCKPRLFACSKQRYEIGPCSSILINSPFPQAKDETNILLLFWWHLGVFKPRFCLFYPCLLTTSIHVVNTNIVSALLS